MSFDICPRTKSDTEEHARVIEAMAVRLLEGRFSGLLMCILDEDGRALPVQVLGPVDWAMWVSDEIIKYCSDEIRKRSLH